VMTNIKRSLSARLFDRLVLAHPLWVLAAVVAVVLLFLPYVTDVDLDASADSLLLEDDADLRYYRGIAARYGSTSYLVVTYSADNLFAAETLADLQQLRDELLALPQVDSVVTLLDVPLINSPVRTLSSLQEMVPTLLSLDTDLALARIELTQGGLYRELIMSRDGKTTALLVNFLEAPELQDFLAERDRLLEQRMSRNLDSAEEQRLAELSAAIQQINKVAKAEQAGSIAEIRQILRPYRRTADVRLGGVPIVVADMIELIKQDVVVFGFGIFGFLLFLLMLVFRQPRWVLILMACCLVSAIVMSGLLGMLQWRVTVVSSNFVALVVIFSLALTVHLIVRYLELQRRNPDASQYWLVQQTLADKFEPCLYTVVTTMVGFASLFISGIRPVIDFGWMMVIGMALVFVVSFLLFPAGLMLLRPAHTVHADDVTVAVTSVLARWVRFRSSVILVVFAALTAAAAGGIGRLQVENRFLDYFAKSTEIYQGLATIDQELGGTMPFDVVLDADPAFFARIDAPSTADDEFGDSEFSDIGFAEDDFASPGDDLGASSYWYNSYQLQVVGQVHDYLDGLPETGKVLSMSTALDALETLNNNQLPGTFFLSILYKQLPETIKAALIRPYMSEDGNQVRFSVRVYESNPDLRRGELLENIRNHLVDGMGFKPEQVHVTGMLVLYNNVLQSLFSSQILTIGLVFLAIVLMYLVLFRSLKMALVATAPSAFAAIAVLGLMGWLGLPLDIMTITIAAITIGIGVDDSIHYVHRFREELRVDGDPLEAMQRSHFGIGRAIYYTSVIITAGFSILAISDFIPTVYFGLFTGAAMLLALFANLTLLPVLLIRFRVR
jgi:uncharacterized protein